MFIDKITHFLAGFFIATIFQFSIPFAIISVILAAFTKEYYDLKINKTIFNWYDFISTIIGGTVGIILNLFIDNIK